LEYSQSMIAIAQKMKSTFILGYAGFQSWKQVDAIIITVPHELPDDKWWLEWNLCFTVQ
jgi:hypothetical protein